MDCIPNPYPKNPEDIITSMRSIKNTHNNLRNS